MAVDRLGLLHLQQPVKNRRDELYEAQIFEEFSGLFCQKDGF